MTAANHQAVYLNAKTNHNNKFPNDVVRALKEFLSFLAGQGVADPYVECRKVLN